MRTTVGDICEPCRITVRGLLSNSAVQGWRYGDWAAHRQLASPEMWCLTHLPTALSLPLVWASFKKLGRAVAAMREIVRLKNSWAVVTQADFTQALGERIQEICERHHAVEGPMQFLHDADYSLLGIKTAERFNGYGGV